MKNKGVIMVHAGAGYHSQSKEKAYQKLCEKACRQAMELLNKGGTSLDAAVTAVEVLEESCITNAGLGSALTVDGTVECDSSVMEGESLLFGAVGAISGVRNPVSVARKVLEGQKQSLTLGRIPPSILVGSGATQWARENGCKSVADGGLVTEASLRTYWQHKRKLEKLENTCRIPKKRKLSRDSVLNPNSNVDNDTAFNRTRDSDRTLSHLNIENAATSNSTVKTDCISNSKAIPATVNEIGLGVTLTSGVNILNNPSVAPAAYQLTHPEFSTVLTTETNHIREVSMTDTDETEDTVGAVCLDCNGGLSSAVSSGGILLKHSGRVGQAAVYGAGCWAEVLQQPLSSPGVAVSTSGCGEHLIRTLLARECAESVKSSDSATMAVSKVFRDKFLGSSMLKNVDEKLAGVIVIKHQSEDSNQEVEMIWAHTTDSMCIGYMVEGRKPKAVISRLPKDGVSGKSFNMQGKHFDVNQS